jgi:hypothetical protein
MHVAGMPYADIGQPPEANPPYSSDFDAIS